MQDLGTRFIEAREAKSLSVEDIAEITKITCSALRALETGQHATLPAPVFVRGFIRAYARVVDLDPHAMVRLYEEATQDPAEADLGQTATLNRPREFGHRESVWQHIPRHFNGMAGGYALLAIALIGFIIAAFAFSNSSPQPETSTATLEATPLTHRPVRGMPQIVPAQPAADVTAPNAR